MIGDPPTDDETDVDDSDNEDDDTTDVADDQNGVTSVIIQGNGSYYSSSNDTGTTSYFSTSPSTTTRATTTRGQTGSDVSTADLSNVFTIYSSTRKPQTNSSGIQDNTGTSDSQDGGNTTVNPDGVTRKSNQGSGNGQSKGKPNGTQNRGKGSQKKPQAKQITAKDWLFKEFNKVKEGDSYYKILKKLGVKHSEQIFEFYKCLFSSKVVTRNVFTGALRRFRDKMDLPENILEKSYTEIFSTYIWEWEPYDIDEYINQYCRIIEAGLDDERKNAVSKTHKPVQHFINHSITITCICRSNKILLYCKKEVTVHNNCTSLTCRYFSRGLKMSILSMYHNIENNKAYR